MSRTETESFFELLEASIVVLRAEMPPAYTALRAALGGRTIGLEADGERRRISFDASGMTSTHDREPARLEIALDRSTVLELIDARLALPEAVLEDRLRLRGSWREIDRFDEAFRAYVRGAVRCPSLPALLSRFRGIREEP